MPTRTKRLCPGCGWIGTGRCPNCTRAHREQTDQQRPTPTERGYNSHWRRTIRPAFLRANPLCVICGQLATVPDHWPETRAELVLRGAQDPDAAHRLRALCKTCHDTYGMSWNPGKQRRINTLVTLVAGPACAGKNTYIEQHAQRGDVIIDYDQIMADLTGQPMHAHDQARVTEALKIRDQMISQLLATGRRGWIIATAPRPRQRHEYNTNVVLLLPTQSVAIERARHERPNGWETFVRRWYRDYTPDDRDNIVHT